MSNCSIALRCDTGMRYQKLDAQTCQWLDKHPKGVREDILCIPNSFKCNISMSNCPIALKYGSYGQISVIKGKYNR